MPNTRRNLVQASTPQKKAKTSRENPSKNEVPDRPPDSSVDEGCQSNQRKIEADEMVSRRSGRQRTVSKRLQDMQLDFGPKKSVLKRQREGPSEAVGKSKGPKKQKLKSQVESPLSKDPLIPEERVASPTDKQVHVSVVSANVDEKESGADASKNQELEPEQHTQLHSNQLEITDQTSTEKTETDAVATKHNLSEETSTDTTEKNKTEQTFETVKTHGDNNDDVNGSSSFEDGLLEEGEVRFEKEPLSQENCETSSLNVVKDSVEQVCTKSSVVETVAENAQTVNDTSESVNDEVNELNTNLEVLDKILKPEDKDGTGGREEDTSSQNQDSPGVPQTDKEFGVSTNITETCLPGENVTWIQLENFGEHSAEKIKQEEHFGGQNNIENPNECDDGKVKESDGIPVESVESKGVQHQFVMLDDGRQLILSDADTLATAADAVASLAQLKDIAYVISDTSNHVNEKGGEVQSESTQNVISKGDPTVKIKFVSLNSPQNSVARKAASLVNQQSLNMRPGPPTLLSQDGFYRCTMCMYKTEKKANWYKHRYTHLGQRRYQCDKCSYKATSSSNLKRHVLIHTDTRFFQCNMCSSQFRQKIHLERHIKYKHEEKNVKCQYCDYVCSNVNPDLRVHMKRRHILQCGDDNEKLQFRCDTCGFVAACNRDLKQHQKFHRPGPELKLYCEYCSFVTDCASRLRRHLMVHSKEKPFRCRLCTYRASQKEHLYRHFKTKHKYCSFDGSPALYDDIDQAMKVSLDQLDPIPAINKTEGHIEQKSEEGEEKEEKKLEEEVASAESSGIVSTDSVVEDPSKDSSQPSDTTDVGHHPPDPLPHEEPVPGEETSEDTPGDLPTSDLTPDVPTMFPQRKKYKPADFSTREKVFTCIHCTMKFAKLINLYKHLAVQHKDVHATRTDGLHSCVWCDYQTNKWKNLLVHMRKHNYREGEGSSRSLYSCVVCSYTNPRRRTLYAHMMKKHKIHIYVKPDGTANCMIDDTVPGTMMSSVDGSKVVVQPPPHPPVHTSCTIADNSPQIPQQYISGISTGDSTCSDRGERTQMVMIELEPGMPATAVEISAPKRAESMDHEAADAIEGLQALAEQVIAVEQEEGQGLVQEEEGLGQGQEEQTTLVDGSNIELSAEQLMQLSSGDYIEINGEMYKVEVAEEETSNNDTSS